MSISKRATETTVEVDRNNIVLRIAGGPVGPKGDPTASIVIKGIVAAWPPVDAAHAKEGDLWVVPDPPPVGAPAWAVAGHGAFWDGHQWLDAGVIQGSKGDRGEPGPPLNIKGTALSWVPDSNAKPGDVWILPDPLPTGTPAGFKAGGAAAWDDVAKRWIPLEAIRGPAGHSITVFGPSPVPPTKADKGDIWLSSDSSLFSATFDPSGIKPIPGPAGAVGPAGPSAFESWKLSVSRPTASLKDFLDAIRGAAGSVGPKGAAGETLKVNGVVATAGDLPKTPPLLTVNVTSDTGHLWVYDPKSASANADGWNDLGKISGPAGAAAFISTAVTAVAALPAKGAAGQMIFVTDTGHLYGWDDTAGTTGAWVDGGKISNGSLDEGTVQGQMLVWDATAKRWSAAAVLQLPTGTTDGDVPSWDDTNKRWAATPVKIPKTIANLADVDDVIGNLGKDCVMVWDEVAQVWTDSRSIEIDDIGFDASGPGTLLEGIAAYSDAGLDPTKDTWAPSCMAVDKYIRERINLEYLLDCNQLSAATNGQRPVWNDTTSRWEPKDPSASAASPIIYVGTGAWNAANVTSGANNYGMAIDAVPSPIDCPPLPGDQYIDLATGVVTSFTGAPGTPTPTTRTTAAIVGGYPRSLSALIDKLGGLTDVTLSSSSDKQILQYESATSQWKNVTPNFLSPTVGYTKAEVDAKIAALMTGHPVQVLMRKFVSGDLKAETFHNVTVKTRVGYIYVMDFGGTFHATHEDSLGYYSFRIDGGERAKYKEASGRGYAQGGSYRYFIDGTGNDVDFSYVNSWTPGVTWEFCWCMLTEMYTKP